jgi:hypothetical protein
MCKTACHHTTSASVPWAAPTALPATQPHTRYCHQPKPAVAYSPAATNTEQCRHTSSTMCAHGRPGQLQHHASPHNTGLGGCSSPQQASSLPPLPAPQPHSKPCQSCTQRPGRSVLSASRAWALTRWQQRRRCSAHLAGAQRHAATGGMKRCAGPSLVFGAAVECVFWLLVLTTTCTACLPVLLLQRDEAPSLQQIEAVVTFLQGLGMDDMQVRGRLAPQQGCPCQHLHSLVTGSADSLPCSWPPQEPGSWGLNATPRQTCVSWRSGAVCCVPACP